MLLTVDTGGTKTLVTYFDRQGRPAEETRFLTPRDREDYVATLVECIHDNYQAIGKLEGVVVGVPGIVRDNTAVWCDNLGWKDFPLADILSKTLNVPVWLENDANLAGLAETSALPSPPETCLYLTVSTGIGTGIIINGKIDPALATSEGGHMKLEYDGRLREWEDFASGSAILSTYGKMARDIHDKKTWRQIADKISRGLLVLIPVLEPDTIIIGGSIGTYFDQYKEPLERELSTQLPAWMKVPEVRQAAHPEEAVIYGCYYYGRDRLAA